MCRTDGRVVRSARNLEPDKRNKVRVRVVEHKRREKTKDCECDGRVEAPCWRPSKRKGQLKRRRPNDNRKHERCENKPEWGTVLVLGQSGGPQKDKREHGRFKQRLCEAQQKHLRKGLKKRAVGEWQ
jgi:hypothetical protein